MITLLTQQEVAHLLGISRSKVSCLTVSGELPCVTMGRLVRYLPSDIDAFIEAHYNGLHIPGSRLMLVSGEVQYQERN